MKRSCRMLSLVLIIMLLFTAAASAAKEAPVFLRMKLPPKGVIYTYFKGEEMRVATSYKGLRNADPIASTGKKEFARETFVYFPEMALPIPEKALPSGTKEIRAAFTRVEYSSKIYATVGFSFKDKEGAKWTYWWRVLKRASKSQSNAPAVNLSKKLKKLSLKVVTRGDSRKKRVGVGLHLKAGSTELVGIEKDGDEIKAHVSIVNIKGEEVASEDGPVSLYGFG